MMGSLAGHISAFVFLFPIGIRRLSSTLSLIHRPSSSFRARPWYMSEHPNPQIRLLRNADLYALLVALPIAAFSHLFLFLTLQSANLAHTSALLLLFFLLLLAPLLPLPLPDDLAFLLAALAFLADYALSSPPSPSPIEGHVYAHAAEATLLCAAACAAMAVTKGAAAVADVALGAGVAMKGLWAMQAGVTLFYEGSAPRGCERKAGWGPLACELAEDEARGVAMVDLLFAGHAVGVAAVCVGVNWAAAREATKKAAGDLDAMITRPMMTMNAVDFEMD